MVCSREIRTSVIYLIKGMQALSNPRDRNLFPRDRRPWELELFAIRLRQILAIDELAANLKILVDPDDEDLAEMSVEIDLNDIAALEWGDRLHLNEIVAQPAI